MGRAEDQDIAVTVDPEWPTTAMGWPVVPDGCRQLLGWIDARYGRPPIVLTENGCAYDAEVVDGAVDDARRVDYHAGYLGACHDAIADGTDLRGYFLWSLLDNFEWASGYDKRFGLHHVDFATGTRTPKASARWYRNVIARGGLADEAPPGDGAAVPALASLPADADAPARLRSPR